MYLAADRNAGAALPEKVVARLLPVLAAAAGSLDVLCVTRLGGVFASVVTGNLVQLGRAVTTVDGALAAGTTAAVGGYALGVAAGTVALRHAGTGWRRRTSLLLAGEALLLAVVAVALQFGASAPTLLCLAATAMGVQSAITIGAGVRGASTTYLTGTVTDVARSLATDPRRIAGVFGALVRVVALLAGATLGALVLRVAPPLAPAVPVALVGAVLVVAIVGRSSVPGHHRQRPGPDSRWPVPDLDAGHADVPPPGDDGGQQAGTDPSTPHRHTEVRGER
jgi:uncharacterized membrane protein YoaK (UPF0700 family)